MLFVLLSLVTVRGVATDLPICSPPPAKKRVVRKYKPKKPVVPEVKIVEKTLVQTIYVKQDVMVSTHYNNRIRLLGGIGPFNTDLDRKSNVAVFSMSYGPLFGVGYTRYLSPKWSLEFEALSNLTGVLGLGYGF